MKFFAVLCLVGLAAASSWGPNGGSGTNRVGWRPNTDYVYEYEGRMLSGIPELASHYSGMGLNCTVKLHVRGDYSFVINIQDPKYVKVNQHLTEGNRQEESNWRWIPLPQYQPVPQGSQIRRHLEEPTVFQLSKSGKFERLTVSGQEPEWSVNFKKALVVLFQTRFEQVVPGGDVKSNILKSQQQGSSSSYWRTQEQSVDGVCDVTYEISEMPQSQVKRQKQQGQIPNGDESNQCQGKPYYQLVKTRDVSSCVKRTAFSSYQPGHFRCSDGNCEGMRARSSITRYYLCGSYDNLQVQKIVNEGELQQELSGFKTEKFLTGTRQVLRLVQQSQGSSSRSNGKQEPSSPVSLKSLFYEYNLKKTVRGGEHILDQAQLESSPSLYQALPANLLTTGSPSDKDQQPSGQEIKGQIKQLFQKLIDEDLQTDASVAERQVTMKVLSIARGFSLLNQRDIGDIYSELKSSYSNSNGSGDKKQMFKNLFFDSLIMGGSVDNVRFIRQQIENGELKRGQASSIFTFLPQYILTPTRGALQNIMELVQSQKVQQDKTVAGHAVMGYTTLLQRACLDKNRENAFPTHVYGNFCSPHSELLTVQWIPYLQNKLQNSQSVEEQNLYVVTLGLLSHKQILPALLPYVEGQGQNQQQQEQGQQGSNITRFLAINALSNAGHYNRDLVLPVLSKIYINQAEQTEQRLAALNVILKLNPPMALLHKIADSTWFEKNEQVLQAVNTAFYTLSQSRSNQQDPAWSIRASLAQKATIIYPLLKAASQRIPTSGTVLLGDYLSQLGAGYHGIFSWIAGDNGDVMPQDIYGKAVYYLGRYQYSPVEMAIRTRNGQNVIKQLMKIISPGQESEQYESIVEQAGKQLHSEWRKALEKIQPEGHKQDQKSFSGYYYATIFENIHLFSSLQTDSEEMLREKIAPLLKGSGEGIQKLMSSEGQSLSVQRTFNLAPYQASIPSDMGFPIIVELHMPVVASIRGNIQLKGTEQGKPKLSASLRTVIAGQLVGWVGTQCPFTKEFVLTGIDEHAVLNLPGQVSMTMDLDQGSFKMEVNMEQQSSGQQKMDLLHYHIRPFTVCQKLNNLQPVTLNQNMRFINARSASGLSSQQQRSEQYSEQRETPFDVRKYQVGDYIGMDLEAVFKTQSPYLDVPQWVQKLRTYNYNPLNMVRFFWASSSLSEQGKPSLRMHEFQLQYNPSQSKTQKIQVHITGASGSKAKQGHSVQFNTIEKKSGSSLMPIKIGSKKIHEIENPSQCHKQVEECIEKMGVESGRGLSAKISVTLSGQGRPRTYVYSINAGSGFQSFVQKWNLQLVSQQNNDQMIKIDGSLRFPKTAQLDVEKLRQEDISMTFQNTIGFGRQGEESKITISGKSQTTEEQKSYSRQSPEAKVYKRMIQQGTPLAKLSQTAEKVRSQATTQDKVDIQVQYQNYPREYLYIPYGMVEYAKAYLISYRQMNTSTYQPNQQQQGGDKVNQKSQFNLRFSPWSQNFNLTMQRPCGETIKFKRIPIGSPLSYVLPVSARRSNQIVSGQRILGVKSQSSSSQVCLFEGNWMETFNHQNMTTNLDTAYHVAVGNCNRRNPNGNGVLIRNMTESRYSNKQVKILLGQTEIVMTPESREHNQNSRVQVTVNGTTVDFDQNKNRHTIVDSHGNTIGQLVANRDQSVITLQSSAYSLNMENQGGYLIKIEEQLPRSVVCGMCTGAGPQKCVYSKDEALTASYKVSGNGNGYRSYAEEGAKCAKAGQVIPTKVIGGYKSQTGKCTQHKHEVIYRGSQICFSQQPIVECGASCRPEGHVKKSVGVVCLQKDRKSERMAQKASEGKTLRELRNLSADYKREETQPRLCVPANSRI